MRLEFCRCLIEVPFSYYCWILKGYLSLLFIKNESSMQTAKIKEGETKKKKPTRQNKPCTWWIIIIVHIRMNKNKPSFKCWFSNLEETIFLFFFWQCFYDLLRMIKQSKSGVRVGTINRRITAPSQRSVDRKSREVKPTDRSSNGCCQIL